MYVSTASKSDKKYMGMQNVDGMNNNMGSTIIYTLGGDIYVGWVAGSLAMISGGLVLFDGCREVDDVDELSQVK